MRIWRGVRLDDRTANMMDEVAELSGPIYINPTQGSYSTSVGASGGTHAGGGAIDLMHSSWSKADYDRVVFLMRKVGFAAWHRTPQQSNWPRHVHGIAVQKLGKSHRGVLSYSAHGQVVAYYEGRNGLASQAKDDGPRRFVGTTWEKYKAEEAEMVNAYKYWYGGKASKPQKLTSSYTRLTGSKYDPKIKGLDFRLCYINASDIQGSGFLRIRAVRADGDKTAYHDYPLTGQGDQLITHVYFEDRGLDGPTYFEVKGRGGVTATLTTRYSKCAAVRR